MLDIHIEETQQPKQKPNPSHLGFGNYFTDHMFMMDFNESKGWYNPRIIPYQPISLSPAAMVLHYAQELFEGLKAYRTPAGEIQLFRPHKNVERLNQTAQRLCMPCLEKSEALQAICELIKQDKDWVPVMPGTSLYIRPFMFATEAHLGVHPAKEYLFMIICSPVASYYAQGLQPVKIYIEKEYVRAVRGGMGFAKTGGNYASSLIGQKKAEHEGYEQVLWLDGLEHKYVDEVGAMNVFFVIDNVVVTPALTSGTLLPGVTRDSCIQLLQSWKIPVEERAISIDELYQAYHQGRLKEAFGSGTAAVISPIGELNDGQEKMILNNGEIGPVAQKLYNTLTDIQWGLCLDPFGWTEKIG